MISIPNPNELISRACLAVPRKAPVSVLEGLSGRAMGL
jgi:hypothetical protein